MGDLDMGLTHAQVLSGQVQPSAYHLVPGPSLGLDSCSSTLHLLGISCISKRLHMYLYI